MFAVYCDTPHIDDPMAGLVIGDQPEPQIPEGWVRVKVTHASLNRHDIFTLRGITAHPEGIRFPMILGNDGAGTLDDGTPVVLYPVISEGDWCGDETMNPSWHILGEFVPGTFADYIAVPRRNAVPLPPGICARDASVLGTAWLTAYRALFTKSGLRPGDTLLVQGASGGMSTALIQLGRAAGFEVWVTSRNAAGRGLAERLGAHKTFGFNAPLPGKVRAVVDSVGSLTFAHSLNAVARGGTVVLTGGTSGMDAALPLLSVIAGQLTVCGTIMGTRQDLEAMVSFIINAGIKPEIGRLLPMEAARDAFQEMVDGNISGKTVLYR